MPPWLIALVVFIWTGLLFMTCQIFGFTAGNRAMASLGVISFVVMIADGLYDWARR